MLPCPGALSRRISPPNSRASSRLMASPSPVPPKVRLVEVSACWNASKISSCFSLGMPMPVSEMAKAMTCGEDRSAAAPNALPPACRLADSSTRPRGVNLNAFESRFLSTCFSPSGSVKTAPGTLGEIEMVNSIPSASVGRNIRSSAATTSCSATGRTSTCSFPDSIFERSRIWLINASRSCPLECTVAAYSTSSESRCALALSASRRARMSRLFKGVRSSCDMFARNSDL